MITVLQFILALSLLIVIHEGGHYFFARLFKTRVERFYLFFDFLFPFSNLLPFSLFKKKIGDTEYGIGWFPLGGYVKIAGMIDESMDKEQMALPPQPWEFRSKPAWQRLFIMLGGIIFNVILAIIIYTFIMWVSGKQLLPMSQVNAKGGVMVTNPVAEKIGFKNGDKILAINGKPVTYFDDLSAEMIYAKEVQINRNNKDTVLQLPKNLIGRLADSRKIAPFFMYPYPAFVDSVFPNSPASRAGLQKDDEIVGYNGKRVNVYFMIREAIQEHKGDTIHLVVKRAGKEIQLPVQVSDSGSVGFVSRLFGYEELEKAGIYDIEKHEYSFLQAIPEGLAFSYKTARENVRQLSLFADKDTEAYKGMGSFISMAKVYGPVWDWGRFWRVTAFLSIILAVMNLLPIPGLDGGYVMFTLYEMITGRKPSDRFMEIATTIGLIFILVLMFYALGNDIFRNFFMK